MSTSAEKIEVVEGTAAEVVSSSEGVSVGGLGTKIKSSLALVQSRVTAVEQRARAQWVGIPTQLRDAVDQVALRVRAALDLPTRAELEELIARVEQLDRQLAELQVAGVKRTNGSVAAKKKAPAKKPAPKKAVTKKKAPAKKKAAKKPAAKKTERKEKIKKAATKRTRK